MELFGLILGIVGVLLSIALWIFPPEKIREHLRIKSEADSSHGALIKKAEAGDESAQCELGLMYMNGDRIPMDYDLGITWLRKAAAQNNYCAINFIGQCYANGWGVKQDLNESVQWYRDAADNDYAAAQYNLGIAYAHGSGVEYDDSKAINWLRKAADQGIQDAEDVIFWIIHFTDNECE
jgi:TPR repeat protein